MHQLQGKLAETTCMDMFLYGALMLLPKILVSYIVGLGIEFAWAQWKGEEIQEGYLVSGNPYSAYHSHHVTALDAGFGSGFCRDIHKGNIWRNGHE